MKKRLLAVGLVFIMTISLLPAAAFAEFGDTSGECGAYGYELIWAIDGNGNLSIAGTGPMDDFGISEERWGGNDIKRVVISEGVTKIGRYAFYQCEDLQNIIIPDSVTEIGSEAFEWSGLQSVKFPDTLTEIGSSAFRWGSLKGIVEIPASVTEIGSQAFCGCGDLTRVDVDEANQVYASENGILFNKDLTTLIYYPIGRTDRIYTIPESVKTIEDRAFYDCVSLTKVEIPDGVGGISYWMFYGCSSLECVTIPKSVKYIAMHAFEKCGDLSDIYYSGTEEEWNAINKQGNNGPLYNAKVHYNSLGFNSFIEPETGIKAKIVGGIPDGRIEFRADKISASDAGVNGLSPDAVIYDIYFAIDGSPVKINMETEVSVPVLKGMDGSTCKVYYIDENGNKIDMNARFENGYMIFTTDHFSLYAVDGEKITGAFLTGDVDDSGSVNATDKAILNRYLAGWDGYAAKILNWDAADIDGKDGVNAKDKAILNRYLAGWSGYDEYFE